MILTTSRHFPSYFSPLCPQAKDARKKSHQSFLCDATSKKTTKLDLQSSTLICVTVAGSGSEIERRLPTKSYKIQSSWNSSGWHPGGEKDPSYKIASVHKFSRWFKFRTYSRVFVGSVIGKFLGFQTHYWGGIWTPKTYLKHQTSVVIWKTGKSTSAAGFFP